MLIIKNFRYNNQQLDYNYNNWIVTHAINKPILCFTAIIIKAVTIEKWLCFIIRKYRNIACKKYNKTYLIINDKRSKRLDILLYADGAVLIQKTRDELHYSLHCLNHSIQTISKPKTKNSGGPENPKQILNTHYSTAQFKVVKIRFS